MGCLLAALSLPAPLAAGKETVFLRVTGTNVQVRIPRIDFTMQRGERLPLVQLNEAFAVGIVTDEEHGVTLGAFPRVRGQSPGWRTEDGFMIFGVPSRAAEGFIRLEYGERLPVRAENPDFYLAEIAHHDQGVLWPIPLGQPGLTPEQAPPPALPDIPDDPVETVVRHHRLTMEELVADPVDEIAPPVGPIASVAQRAADEWQTRRRLLIPALAGLLLLFLLFLVYRSRQRPVSPVAASQTPPARAPPDIQRTPASSTDAGTAQATGATMVLQGGSRPSPRNAAAHQPMAIGKYRILKTLGQGSMGVVYQAYQEDLNRVVALKMLKEGEHADERQRKRFLREARTAAKLRHPNIITVYEVGEFERQPFIAMEFIEGNPLDRVIDENPPGGLEAARLCRQIAEAVHYAHQQGVIHRDLKPANIIIQPGSVPVITDFGLARDMQDALASMSGDIVGTPSYMSPEQARGQADEIDARTDVYALGAVLYALLARRNPLDKGSLIETLTAVLHEEPAPLSTVAPDTDADLAALCARAMAKDKNERYASAGHFAAALSDYIEDHIDKP